MIEASRHLTAVFGIAHPFPGSEHKLMDLACELNRRGYPEPLYVSPHFLRWGQIGVGIGGGSIIEGEHANLVLWSDLEGGVTLTPLCGSVAETADHLDRLREHGWVFAG
jgi:hypothetical protein